MIFFRAVIQRPLISFLSASFFSIFFSAQPPRWGCKNVLYFRSRIWPTRHFMVIFRVRVTFFTIGFVRGIMRKLRNTAIFVRWCGIDLERIFMSTFSCVYGPYICVLKKVKLFSLRFFFSFFSVYNLYTLYKWNATFFCPLNFVVEHVWWLKQTYIG